MSTTVVVWLWPATKGHAIALSPLPPLGWGGEWKEKKAKILWVRIRAANAVNSNNNYTDKENIQIKQRNAQSNSHCLMLCMLLSRDCLPATQLPPPWTRHGGTCYRIPCSVWQVWVSLAGCVPSWLLVKIKPLLVEPRTTTYPWVHPIYSIPIQLWEKYLKSSCQRFACFSID